MKKTLSLFLVIILSALSGCARVDFNAGEDGAVSMSQCRIFFIR
jgi:hypothetical protein